jgi:hypothetical protein
MVLESNGHGVKDNGHSERVTVMVLESNGCGVISL